jgi:hypothetical protein
LQNNRDVKAVKSNNTAALLEEILVERIVPRKVEWFDAKRLRRGITRTGNQRVKGAEFNC